MIISNLKNDNIKLALLIKENGDKYFEANNKLKELEEKNKQLSK